MLWVYQIWSFCKGLANKTSKWGSRTDTTNVQYGWRSDSITNPTDGHRSRWTDYKPSRDQRQFKLIEGKNDSTTFLPLGPQLGGNSKKTEVNKNDSIDKSCLSSRQVDNIYKKVELGSLINKNTMKEEIDPDVELDRMDNNSGVENRYKGTNSQ